MKTYFRYEGIIKSKEAAEAIAAPIGLGPFCGFGSGIIQGTNITLYPNSFAGDKFSSIVEDRIRARYLVKDGEGELPEINFGCISRDGYVFISDDPTMALGKILGSQGSTQEVLVFAVHTPISEPVDNPVNFVAYWNESSESFYDLFKRSQDIYYPESQENRKPNIQDIPDFSYSELDEMAANACQYYKANKQSVVLIGIYGTGMNAITRRQENFAIVPYNGKFGEIPFTTSVYSSIKESVKKTEEATKDFPVIDEETKKPLNVKEYIDNELEKIRKEFAESQAASGLPLGSIILWESDKIPDGWSEYSKAAGRIVLGYQAGGISIGGGDMVLVNVGDFYNPQGGTFTITIKPEDLPKHYHSMGLIANKMDLDGKESGVLIQNFKNRQVDLDGNRGQSGDTTVDIYKGTLLSSANLMPNSRDIEVNNEEVHLEKLPPTLTLRYIQKTS